MHQDASPQDNRALGDYIAHLRTARDAAQRRHAAYNNLGLALVHASQHALQPEDVAGWHAAIDAAAGHTRRMAEAVERANEAAALCGEPAVSVASLLRSKD